MLLLGLLGFLPVLVAGRVTFLSHNNAASMSASNEVDVNSDEEAGCNCECCLSQQGDQIANVPGASSLTCSPRSSVGGADGDGGCPQQCMPDSTTQYEATGSLVDYARFCVKECTPASMQVNELCTPAQVVDGTDADASTVAPKSPSGDSSIFSAAAAADLGGYRAPPDQAMTQTATHVDIGAKEGAKQAPDISIAAAIALAKGDMVEAKIHAKAAGHAALLAKESYEQVRRAARSSAEEAGKAVLREIKREGGEQAKQALEIRMKYEEAAKANAINAAMGIAQVYYDAMNKVAATALGWSLRSGAYAGAASSRRDLAKKMSARAQDYLKLGEWELARREKLDAHQTLDQGEAFRKMAENAYKQATDLAKSEKWYIWAEQAAAVNAVTANMPPDVAPPGLPPLPGSPR